MHPICLDAPSLEPLSEFDQLYHTSPDMAANIKAMEPEAMLRTWLPATLKSFEQMQEIFIAQMAGTRRE